MYSKGAAGLKDDGGHDGSGPYDHHCGTGFIYIRLEVEPGSTLTSACTVGGH